MARLRRVGLVCTALLLVALWMVMAEHTDDTSASPSPRPLLDLQQQPADPPRPATPGPTRSPVHRSAPAPVNPAERVVLLDESRLLEDTEYRDAEFMRVRDLMPFDYPGLIDALGLTAQEADSLFDLLTEVQLQKRSVNVPVIIGQPPDVAAVQAMADARQEIQRQRNTLLTALLGPAGFDRFTRYEEEDRPARNQVTSLGRTLATAGQPLEETQLRPLMTAFAALQKLEREEAANAASRMSPRDLPAGSDALPVPRLTMADLERRAVRNQRLLEAATPHLNATQVTAFATELDRSLAQARAAVRVQGESAGR